MPFKLVIWSHGHLKGFFLCPSLPVCSSQNEGSSDQPRVIAVCRQKVGGALFLREGEAQRSSLLLLHHSALLHYSHGGFHRPTVSSYMHISQNVFSTFWHRLNMWPIYSWCRLAVNYVTLAIGELLLIILTVCSLAAVFPRVRGLK